MDHEPTIWRELGSASIVQRFKGEISHTVERMLGVQGITISTSDVVDIKDVSVLPENHDQEGLRI